MNTPAPKGVVADDLCSYLETYAAGLAHTVTLIHSGEVERAGRNTAVAVDGLEWIVRGVGLLLGDDEVASDRVRDLMNDLARSLDNRDHVFTADLFEYDLLPLILDWRDLLHGAAGGRV